MAAYRGALSPGWDGSALLMHELWSVGYGDEEKEPSVASGADPVEGPRKIFLVNVL